MQEINKNAGSQAFRSDSVLLDHVMNLADVCVKKLDLILNEWMLIDLAAEESEERVKKLMADSERLIVKLLTEDVNVLEGDIARPEESQKPFVFPPPSDVEEDPELAYALELSTKDQLVDLSRKDQEAASRERTKMSFLFGFDAKPLVTLCDEADRVLFMVNSSLLFFFAMTFSL
jgi:hypothetical protein